MINKSDTAHRVLDRITRITMLLCFVKRLGDIYFASFRGFFQEGGFRAWGCCGQDREGPLAVEGKLLLGQCDTRSRAVSGCVDWRTS
jgi:hypothetical protein